MLTVPAWAADALTDTHRASWRATLTPRTGAPIVLPVTAGSVVVDSLTYPRTTARVSLGDLALAPRSATGPVTPFGARLDLDYTLADASGRSFTLRAAPTLIVDTVEVDRGPSVGMTVTASDPSLAVSTDTYPTPSDPPSTARTVSALIEFLIMRTHPYAVMADEVNSTRFVGTGYQVEGSPWAAIEDLADSIGAEVYVTTEGLYRVRLVPAIGSPAATLAVGEGGTVTAIRSAVVRGYNRVALTFRDDSGRTTLGLWADRSGGVLDVTGPYGRVTLAESRDRAATQAEADAAAARYARRVAGRVRDVEVSCVGTPWIEPGDTVRVVFPNGPDSLVVTRAEHDLGPGAGSRFLFRTDTLGPV